VTGWCHRFARPSESGIALQLSECVDGGCSPTARQHMHGMWPSPAVTNDWGQVCVSAG
jgi:hypothetical protein